MSLGTSSILQLVRKSRVLGQRLDQHDTQSLLEVLLNVIFDSGSACLLQIQMLLNLTSKNSFQGEKRQFS